MYIPLGLTVKSTAFFPFKRVYVFRVIQNNPDRLVFIIEVHCVLCKTQTEYFCAMRISGPG